MNEDSKKTLMEFGQVLLALFIGNMTALTFIKAGYLKGDTMIVLGVVLSNILWFTYIDLLKWLAKKIPDEVKK